MTELHETIADIAYGLGTAGFTTGDSREDVKLIVDSAMRFEEEHKNTEWGFDKEYIETVDEFIDSVIRENTNKG